MKSSFRFTIWDRNLILPPNHTPEVGGALGRGVGGAA